MGMFMNLMKKMEENTNALVISNKSTNDTLTAYGSKLVSHENIMKVLSNKQEEQDGKIINLTNRIEDLEYNAELTTSQVTNIVEKAKRKVIEYLPVNTEEIIKYFRTYIADLYRFLKPYGKASKIERTENRFYGSIMSGIDEWIPNEKQLRERKDFRDEVNSRNK